MGIATKRLFSIPDDILAKSIIADSNIKKRVDYIVEEYENLVNTLNTPIPPITSTTTMKEIKDNLDSLMEEYPEDVIEVLKGFTNEFYPGRIRSMFMMTKIKILALIITGCMLVIFAFTILLYGVITGTWDVNAIGSHIWNALASFFSNTLMGGIPDPGM